MEGRAVTTILLVPVEKLPRSASRSLLLMRFRCVANTATRLGTTIWSVGGWFFVILTEKSATIAKSTLTSVCALLIGGELEPCARFLYSFCQEIHAFVSAFSSWAYRVLFSYIRLYQFFALQSKIPHRVLLYTSYQLSLDVHSYGLALYYGSCLL